jgi:hypothetical protein
MHEVDCIDHQAFLSARLRWVSAMDLCGVSQIGFAASGGQWWGAQTRLEKLHRVSVEFKLHLSAPKE